ncbi:hypothetical protein XELAEV_18009583mg [Xenopus laevis]|uniref:Uncharacterized protein n=1 Tax=Xenopus laevis TaxID=8355 RepID=A0A974DSZ2_XENLA|nr:hypothetical protein XELAEV_18009583mg [Xenopus laevis]
MSSKFMGKTYEKQCKKNTKQLVPNAPISCQSQRMFSQDLIAEQEHTSIASEVARLLNPVIEQSIDKAIGKLQLEISKISQQLGSHDKKFSELKSTVSSIYDDSFRAQRKIESLEKHTQELLLKVDDLENRSRHPTFSRDLKQRSRSRSPISHKERSPLISSEEDTMLELNFLVLVNGSISPDNFSI